LNKNSTVAEMVDRLATINMGGQVYECLRDTNLLTMQDTVVGKSQEIETVLYTVVIISCCYHTFDHSVMQHPLGYLDL